MQIEMQLLEYNKGVYLERDYSNIVARYNDKLVKFKLDLSKVGDLSSMVDKKVLCSVEIRPGKGMSATPWVVSASIVGK